MRIVQESAGWRVTDKDGCNEIFDTKKEALCWYKKYGSSSKKSTFWLGVMKVIGVICAIPVAVVGLFILGVASSNPKPKRIWVIEEY